MAQKDIKKLTTAELKKQVKKLDEVQEFVVNIGGIDYRLTHDVKFRMSKQYKFLDDIIKFLNESSKRIELLDLVTSYTALLLIKHFTSLEVSDDIDEALALMEVLVDLEAFDKILNALPQDEVTKVYELLADTVEKFTASLEEAEKEAEELADKVENEELKEMIKNDGESDSEGEAE